MEFTNSAMDPPIIGVPSDSSSGLQPDLSSQQHKPPTEEGFEPLKCPDFAPKLNLPCDSGDPLAIFELFFPIGQITTIVENTNKKAYRSGKTTTCPYAREWKDVSIAEVYTWLAILIYMGLYPLNDIESYWTRNNQKPIHKLVYLSMGCNRWEQIHRYLHISLPVIGPNRASTFSKVLSAPKMVFYTNLYGYYFR